jgi:hypothetical protein
MGLWLVLPPLNESAIVSILEAAAHNGKREVAALVQ